MRTPIIAGNWKMNNTIADGIKLVKDLAVLVADAKKVDIRCMPYGNSTCCYYYCC